MPREDEITLDLHGLDADNRIVRATVFVQKFRQLLTALLVADKLANGKPGFDYVITGLKIGSASVTVREKQRRRERPSFSSIRYFEDTASAVYNGDRALERLPPDLVRSVQKLSNGVEQKFSHAEIAFADNVIRIDDYLQHQANVAYELATLPAELQRSDQYYRGIANGSFDGILKEIDARGTMLRGKLVLSAGGIEIDCVMNKERVRQAGERFDKRVIVEGAAHYDGVNQIPARIDVREIKVVGEGNLLRWRGAFRSPRPEELEDDDW